MIFLVIAEKLTSEFNFFYHFWGCARRTGSAQPRHEAEFVNARLKSCSKEIMRQLLACNRGVITSQKWSHNFSQASFHCQNRRSASISVGYATAQYATRRLLARVTEELKVIGRLLSLISDDWTRNWGPQPCHSASAHFRHWILTPNPWQMGSIQARKSWWPKQKFNGQIPRIAA